MGESNEANVFIDNVPCKALVDSGAQLSTICASFVELLGLEVHPLTKLLDIEGTGGGKVPYKGYAEVNLKVEGVEGYNKDVLMLVIPNSRYTYSVPIQIGTLHIDQILEVIKPDEISNMNKSWKRSGLATVLAGKSAVIAKEGNTENFDLGKIKGKVKLTKKVVIPPFATMHVSGITKIQGHTQNINVMTEVPDNWAREGFLPMPTYSQLKTGSRRVDVILKNISCVPKTIKARSVIGVVTAANIVPPMLAKSMTIEQETKNLAAAEIEERLKVLLSKVDLSGSETWSEEDKNDAIELVK